MSGQPTERQFLRKAAIIGISGGILLAGITAFIEAYDAAYGSKSGHGGWSTLLSMVVRVPSFYFLTALRLDHVFAPTTRFGESALVVVANGVCVLAVVMAFAVFLVVCRRALDHDNRAAS